MIKETAHFNDENEVKVIDARNRALIADEKKLKKRTEEEPSTKMKNKNLKNRSVKNLKEMTFGGNKKNKKLTKKGKTTANSLKKRIEELEQVVYDSMNTQPPKRVKRQKIKNCKKSKSLAKSKKKTPRTIVEEETPRIPSREETTIHTKETLKTRNVNFMDIYDKPKTDPLLEREYIERVRDSNFALVKDLEEKKREIERLRSKLNMRELNLGEASTGLNMMQDNEERFRREIDLLRKENMLLEERNSQLRKDLHSNIHDRKGESYLLLENDNLKADVIRLIKMLQNTKEYQDFANYADASGSIHYLKSIGKFSKLDLAERFNDLKNLKQCQKKDLFISEKSLWVPEEAYKFAHKFRLQYNGQLTDTLIEQLLFELNKIWNQREKRIIGGIKSKYSNEAGYLRRKIANTPSLEMEMLKKENKRLKKDLKNARNENVKLHAGRPHRNPKGAEYVKEALKMAHTMDVKKTYLEKQNTYFRSVAEAYQKVIDDDYKGNIFLQEGVKIANEDTLKNLSKVRSDIQRMINKFDRKQSHILKQSGKSREKSTLVHQNRESFLFNLSKKLDGICDDVNSKTKHADKLLMTTKVSLAGNVKF